MVAKKIIPAIVLSVLFWQAPAQNIVSFKISKPYNILNFLETAIGKQGTSPTLKRFIEQKIPKDDKVFEKLLDDFTRIPLYYTYRREELPANRKQFGTTYDLIIIAAVQSNTLQEFKKRSVGILANNKHQELFRVLAAAEKYYDQSVWTPYKASTIKQLQSLEKYKGKLDSFFLLFSSFYYSSWTSDIPFDVALYPIPGRTGNSTATPHANSLCVGVLTEETDPASRIGVVAHEMCHVLYDEQTSTFQHYLDSAFAGSSSVYSKLASSFFDEALATALGNAWTYQYINNRPDTGSWYANTYIDGFAHAIYPLVNQYLQQKKPIDRNFVEQAIKLFGETFPKSTTDYSILLNNAYVYMDFGADQRLLMKNLLQQHFGSTRYNVSSPILHEYSIESLKRNRSAQLIIIDRDHTETMKKMKELFPEITQLISGKTATNYILNFFAKTKQAIIIINIENTDHLEKAFSLIGKRQYLDESTPYMLLE